MIDDVAQEAAAVRAAGGNYSKAVIRRPAEAGTTPDALATENIRDGKLSQGTWLDGIQSLADRWQYTGGPGELPHGLRTPTGAAVMQYKSFSLKAAQHFLDDVAKLKLEALRTGDESLNKLANQRIKTFTLVTMPRNAATSAVKSLARGRLPSMRAAGEAMFKGPMGVVGDGAVTAGKLASGHNGEHPIGDFLDVPALSVPAGAVEDTARGLTSGEPLLAAKGAATLGGLYSPNISLYSSMPLGLANSLLK